MYEFFSSERAYRLIVSTFNRFCAFGRNSVAWVVTKFQLNLPAFYRWTAFRQFQNFRQAALEGGTTADTVALTTWKDVVKDMRNGWKIIGGAASVMASCCIGAPQLNPAIVARPISRTLVFATLIFSLSSIVSSFLYTFSGQIWLDGRHRAQWEYASESEQRNVANEIWGLLAIPLVLLAWASMSFLGVIVVLIYVSVKQSTAPPDDSSNLAGYILTGSVLVVVSALCLERVYRAAKFLHADCNHHNPPSNRSP